MEPHQPRKSMKNIHIHTFWFHTCDICICKYISISENTGKCTYVYTPVNPNTNILYDTHYKKNKQKYTSYTNTHPKTHIET